MTAVFADTAFFVAYLNRHDEFHVAACEQMRSVPDRRVTTEFLLLELANFLSSSHVRTQVAAFWRDLVRSPRWEVVPATAGLLQTGLAQYDRRPDKQWSLTDCISFQVMQQNELTDALTTDHHFEQAGFQILLR
jgi:predicted nucleic acid-binding protein